MQLEIDSESLGDDIPAVVYNVMVECEGKLWAPDDGAAEDQAYQHAIRGKCMACGTDLAGETLLVVDHRGLIGVWCTPDCMADMHSLSFLREVEEAVVTRIEEREAS